MNWTVQILRIEADPILVDRLGNIDTHSSIGIKHMSKIGLFFGTQTGKTEMIWDEFGTGAIDLHDMSSVDIRS